MWSGQQQPESRSACVRWLRCERVRKGRHEDVALTESDDAVACVRVVSSAMAGEWLVKGGK